MSAVDRCPTCKGPRKHHPENASFPFCSGRCKLADLSNWLEGRYSLEAEPAGTEDGEEPPPRLH
ncbi:MAG: DNA gyrase inhibitor YacG [Myxococcales bacterium]